MHNENQEVKTPVSPVQANPPSWFPVLEELLNLACFHSHRAGCENKPLKQE
jgi:hypothetical protein